MADRQVRITRRCLHDSSRKIYLHLKAPAALRFDVHGPRQGGPEGATEQRQRGAAASRYVEEEEPVEEVCRDGACRGEVRRGGGA
jgi:hypothetical protein